MVQTLHELDLLLEGVYAEVGFAHREAARITLYLLAVFDFKAFGELQRFDLRQRKVDGVVAAVFARAVREAFGDVGDAIEVMVVQYHQLVVLGHHQILFEVIGALGVGHRFRRQGVFRQVAAGAAVGDHHFVRRLRGADHRGGENDPCQQGFDLSPHSVFSVLLGQGSKGRRAAFKSCKVV